MREGDKKKKLKKKKKKEKRKKKKEKATPPLFTSRRKSRRQGKIARRGSGTARCRPLRQSVRARRRRRTICRFPTFGRADPRANTRGRHNGPASAFSSPGRLRRCWAIVPRPPD